MKILKLAGGHGGRLGPHVGPGQSPGGERGREAPRKLLDFSNLKTHKTALKLWKFKTKQTNILLI